MAQTDLADQVLEVTDEKTEISDEDKAKAAELKKYAAENLSKYLEMTPDTEDRKTIEELIAEINSFINGETSKAEE